MSHGEREILAAHRHDGALHAAVLVEHHDGRPELAGLGKQDPQQDGFALPRHAGDDGMASRPVAFVVLVEIGRVEVEVERRAGVRFEHRDGRTPGVAGRLASHVVVKRREAKEILRRNRRRTRAVLPVARQLRPIRGFQRQADHLGNDGHIEEGRARLLHQITGFSRRVAEDGQRGVMLPKRELAGHELIESHGQLVDLIAGRII